MKKRPKTNSSGGRRDFGVVVLVMVSFEGSRSGRVDILSEWCELLEYRRNEDEQMGRGFEESIEREERKERIAPRWGRNIPAIAMN